MPKIQPTNQPEWWFIENYFWYSDSMQKFLQLYNPIFRFGWLLGFYGISTFVGYLTPNSVYI